MQVTSFSFHYWVDGSYSNRISYLCYDQLFHELCNEIDKQSKFINNPSEYVPTAIWSHIQKAFLQFLTHLKVIWNISFVYVWSIVLLLKVVGSPRTLYMNNIIFYSSNNQLNNISFNHGCNNSATMNKIYM